ncbi:hypothetical protein A2714_03745 [Candidatus Woesebacteria bacterium RIFCSPHIGHO2_01_FULL_38_9]|uniref:Uncharacterized protein n=2 Tax=Candidatus Woeseibacteriota TaxID=1752722 RepID=A0A1F7Y0D0_9BACT|nr:MAG: hypothetical protein A2714_03745 [Candidatus Woesebacteria bacterium RIFCSPHIGHO2_01_FULL_38_9]OGM59145.1 MAG: hypothetical protein A3A75_02910 [Candidatus Woesebacteria bacterium RIFCSPLOWO2_01_FULL_39_10]
MKKDKSKRKVSFKENKDKLFFYSACAVIIIIALSLFNFSLFIYPKKTVKTQDNVQSKDEIFYWEGFVREHPSYIAGWLELAKSYYKIGEFALAQSALQNAESIDPNSEDLKSLKTKFNN